jgi:Flp pilus assembly protein TadG
MRQRRGVVALEFALIAFPMVLLFLLCLEVAWQASAGAALDYAALKASRFGIVGADRVAGRGGSPTCRSAAIPWIVTDATAGFLRQARLQVRTSSYLNYASASAGLPGAAGAGAGGQIVIYRLEYRQPFMAEPLARLVTGDDHLAHTATIIVKNEPFENATC